MTASSETPPEWQGTLLLLVRHGETPTTGTVPATTPDFSLSPSSNRAARTARAAGARKREERRRTGWRTPCRRSPRSGTRTSSATSPRTTLSGTRSELYGGGPIAAVMSGRPRPAIGTSARLRCPLCRTLLGSLAWHDPGLAAEWSPANLVSAWDVRPLGSTPFTPEWICATNGAHVWQSPLSGRSSGAECPECKVAGKSKIELVHHAAAVDAFSSARSDAILRS